MQAKTVNTPLMLADLEPSIKDLRQIGNGNGELELMLITW